MVIAACRVENDDGDDTVKPAPVLLFTSRRWRLIARRSSGDSHSWHLPG
jgi:hypothetical protein